MKKSEILLLIFMLGFLETTVLPFNLTFLFVISFAAVRPTEDGLVIAFLTGLIVDLFSGRPLGSSSLLFLFLSFLVSLYKNRFQADKLLFILPFSLIALLLTLNWQKQIFSPFKILVSLFLASLFLTFLKRSYNQEEPERRLQPYRLK